MSADIPIGVRAHQTQEQGKSSHHKPEPDQPNCGPNPGQKSSLGREEDSWIGVRHRVSL